MKPLLSIAEENYIKAIYHLQQQKETVNTNEVAKEINTKAASVTDMLKKLKQKKILQYEKYKGFKLSNDGKKIALNIVRKHRLWEYFLVEKLQLGWDEVHEIAEQLEHINSKKLIDKLDKFLEYPKYDPHGDPIPDANGKFEVRKKVCLTELPINTKAEVIAVANQTTSLLEMLHKKQIGLGTCIQVKQKFEFDDSIDVSIKPNDEFNISKQLAEVLFVKILN